VQAIFIQIKKRNDCWDYWAEDQAQIRNSLHVEQCKHHVDEMIFLPSILFRESLYVVQLLRSIVHSSDRFVCHIIETSFGRTSGTSLGSRAKSRRDLVRRLCAEAGESAGVAEVGGVAATATARSAGSSRSTTALAATTSTTALTASAVTTTATALAATERSTALATATAATVTAATARSTLTGRGREHALAVKLDVNLLLALALTLGLAAGGSEKVLLLAGDLGALGEVLGAALVGLAQVLLTEVQLLLSQLGEVGDVGLGVVLGLSLSSLSLGILLDGLLLLLLGDGLTGLLISKLGLASLGTPAVSSLLLVLTKAGPAVAVTLLAGKTSTASTGTAATTAATTTATTLLLGLARSASTVAAGTGTAIPKRVVVRIVALLSAGLVALALNGGSGLDVRAVALAVPRGSLVDGLCRGLSWPVGVELRVVAQQLVHVLGSNCRHLDGLERLVRFALLDAQSAGVKRKMRELALRY